MTGKLIQKFSLESVGKSAGVFNSEKLLDLNAWYIRESSDESIAEQLMPFLQKIGIEKLNKEKVKGAAGTLKARSKTLVEMAEGACFYFQDEISYEIKSDKKFLKPNVLGLLEELQKSLEKAADFTQVILEQIFSRFQHSLQRLLP